MQGCRLMKHNFVHQIEQCILKGKWRISYHALKRCDERNLELQYMLDAVIKSEIIEEYPGGQRGSSCLLLGKGADGRPMHIVCAIDDEGYLIIITAYHPEQSKWIDERTRRRQSDE